MNRNIITTGDLVVVVTWLHQDMENKHGESVGVEIKHYG